MAPSATASGADTGGNDSARNRDHKQGNQERKYTVEQKAAVLRIRRCSPTAFYDILGLAAGSACSDAEIKKAYRKQSLLTHPDKNGHEHADEAFKMVSRAFGVLGDKEKRDKFDRFGTDPDSRFESARAQSNPFGGGFGGGGGGGRGPAGFGRGNMWEDEMSPEEMFQRFFGGGGFGGPFGGFDTGPQFVFNLGGQRGFRVHQMGGAGPRRRPRDAAAAAAAANAQRREASGWDTVVSLLPIIFLFLFPLLTSLFSSGESQPSMPSVVFDHERPPHHVLRRASAKLDVPYYVNPREVAGWSDHSLGQLDRQADVKFVNLMRGQCEAEMRTRQDMVDKAQGWFFPDAEKMQAARNYEMPSCKRLEKLNVKNIR